MRDEQTTEVYLPLNSTVVRKLKHEMLYVPLDFGNILTVAALVDSGEFVSAIAWNDLDTMKEKAPIKIPQNRRSSQFSGPSSQWPGRKTIINNLTKL